MAAGPPPSSPLSLSPFSPSPSRHFSLSVRPSLSLPLPLSTPLSTRPPALSTLPLAPRPPSLYCGAAAQVRDLFNEEALSLSLSLSLPLSPSLSLTYTPLFISLSLSVSQVRDLLNEEAQPGVSQVGRRTPP